MRHLASLIISLLLLAVLTACTSNGPGKICAADPALADLVWLTGAWVSVDDKSDTITEEHWTSPCAGTMFGINRTVAGDETVFFEYLRIEHRGEGEIIYLAAPRGRHPATEFRLIGPSPTRFVFENPENDYPQRIIYEHYYDGSLVMTIEGVEDGKPKSAQWHLRPAHINPAPPCD